MLVKRRKNRKALSAEESKRAILDAAYEQFSRNGYHGTRVKAIAREAGVSEGLIYHHFNSKYDLLIGIFRIHMVIDPDYIRESLEEQSDLIASKNVEELLRGIFHVLGFRLSGKDGPGKLLPIILNSMSSLSEEEKDRFVTELHESFWNPISRVIHDLLPDQYKDSIDPYIFFRMIQGIFMGYYLFQEIFDWNKIVPIKKDQYIDQAVAILARGLDGIDYSGHPGGLR